MINSNFFRLVSELSLSDIVAALFGNPMPGSVVGVRLWVEIVIAHRTNMEHPHKNGKHVRGSESVFRAPGALSQ